MILRHAKKLAMGALAAGTTLLMAACYGVTDNPEMWSPSGTARNSVTGEGVQGLQVCAVQQEYSACTETSESGRYWLDADPSIHYDAFQVCIEDIDGAENGSFESECISVDAYTEYPEVDFELTPKSE